MIDIHHHLLPGTDDGAGDIETSVAMCRLAAAEGITHIVATPHANDKYPYDPATNGEKLEALRGLLARDGIPVTLGLGCDFHLSYDNIQSALKDSVRHSINGLGYLLVELPDYGLPKGLTSTFYEMQLAKSTPILTHPERNPTLQGDRSRMKNWLRGGMLVQVTCDSVTGQMGRRAEAMAHQLLADRWVHFLASDAHSATRRPPRMREAHDLVAKKYGREYADRICIENPLAVFEGRPLGPQDEPAHLYEDMEEKTSWLGRIFGR